MPHAGPAGHHRFELCEILLKLLPIGGRAPQKRVDFVAVVAPPSAAEPGKICAT